MKVNQELFNSKMEELQDSFSFMEEELKSNLRALISRAYIAVDKLDKYTIEDVAGIIKQFQKNVDRMEFLTGKVIALSEICED